MSIVQHNGKPDFFITFTCNPKWKEITQALLPHQAASDRPDIVACVFKLKLCAFLNDIYFTSNPILGRMVAMIYVIERQKRGPPHAHILTICAGSNKLHSPEDYDNFVCAEIPDRNMHPELHRIVTSFMIHGPCGSANLSSPCMVDGKCTKNFQSHSQR